MTNLVAMFTYVFFTPTDFVAYSTHVSHPLMGRLVVFSQGVGAQIDFFTFTAFKSSNSMLNVLMLQQTSLAGIFKITLFTLKLV